MAKKRELTKPIGWNVLKIANYGVRLGTIKAPDEARYDRGGIQGSGHAVVAGQAMTRRKGEISRSYLKHKWPQFGLKV